MKKEKTYQFSHNLLAVVVACMSLTGLATISTSAYAQDTQAPQNSLTQDVDGETIGNNCDPTKPNTCQVGQTVEIRYEANCPSGMTGQNQYQRKVYTRPSGTRVEDPWYLTQNNCIKVVEPALTPGQVTQTNNMISSSMSSLNSILNNMTLTPTQTAQLQSMLGNTGAVGQGSMTTPMFRVSADYNSSTGNSTFVGVCVKGIAGTNPTMMVRKVSYGFDPGVNRPYPAWTGTDDTYNPTLYLVGPICPAGSTIQAMGGVSTPGTEIGGPGSE